MTCCLVPRYATAHYVLKTLAYTVMNLRHYGLHCSRVRYLCLHSPADRATIALVRAIQKSCRNDTHLRIARLFVATHPSYKLSQTCCG